MAKKNQPSEALDEQDAVSPSSSPALPQEDVLADAVSGALPAPNEKAIEAQAARMVGDDAEAPKKRGKYKPRKRAVTALPGSATAEVAENICRKSGEACADTLVALGITLGGEDWRTVPPVVDADGKILHDERANLRGVWGDLFVEYQWAKMPAWAACAMVTGAYILPRLTAPSTLSRVDRVKLWFANRAASKKAKEKSRA